MEQNTNHKPIVLYVDDVQANLMLFQASFGSYFEVLLADSGKSALEVLKNQEVHVLVSDQNMPEMTGNDLLQIVAKKYPDIMRFMITAYTDYDVVVDAINKGDPYGFFNKPYNREDVKNAIERSLEVRNLRIKNREMVGKLEKANEMMLGMERSKTNFLNSLTEDIRTPINKIMTAVHMIKDKIDSSEITELLNLLDVSVSKLESFSESTRHLERLYDPDVALDIRPVSLNEIIEIGIIENNNLITGEDIEIDFDGSGGEIEVQVEYDLLQSAFVSLLGFMIEHTEGGSVVTLSTGKSEKNCQLNIRLENYRFTDRQIKEFKELSNDGGGGMTDKEFSLEVFLTSEIMKAHGGRLDFTTDKKAVQFELYFPG